jgi:ATP-dependent Clp protease ATP-binding subunit ClpB
MKLSNIFRWFVFFSLIMNQSLVFAVELNPIPSVLSCNSAISPKTGSIKIEDSEVLDHLRIPKEIHKDKEAILSRVVGQDEAVKTLLASLPNYYLGMPASEKPISTLLLMGPTGSGKTLLARVAAEVLSGSRDDSGIIRINCGEYSAEHSIAKIIGPPPGYLGWGTAAPLFTKEKFEKNKLTFILFDEIEKSSPALWNLLLGILDGNFTLPDNSTLHFGRTVVLMTSNIGEEAAKKILKPDYGFMSKSDYMASNHDSTLAKKVEEAKDRELRKKFSPEFLNRIDHTIMFNSLGEKDLRKIIDIEISKLQKDFEKLSVESEANASAAVPPFILIVTPAVKDFLVNDGLASQNARAKVRAIERLIKPSLSNLILTGQIKAGDVITVDYKNNGQADPEFIFSRQKSSIIPKNKLKK